MKAVSIIKPNIPSIKSLLPIINPANTQKLRKLTLLILFENFIRKQISRFYQQLIMHDTRPPHSLQQPILLLDRLHLNLPLEHFLMQQADLVMIDLQVIFRRVDDVVFLFLPDFSVLLR